MEFSAARCKIPIPSPPFGLPNHTCLGVNISAETPVISETRATGPHKDKRMLTVGDDANPRVEQHTWKHHPHACRVLYYTGRLTRSRSSSLTSGISDVFTDRQTLRPT